MTSKQRAYLKSLAMTMDPILQIGKSSVTPELTAAVAEALEARELIKLHVLQNCGDDLRGMAEILAERTRSQVVQVIGRKIVSVAVHPNGELYYVKRKTGELIRFDMQTKEEKVLYALGDGEPMFFIFMHPSGNYAYISFSQWKTILKIPYDWKNKTLLTASILCGQQNRKDGLTVKEQMPS